MKTELIKLGSNHAGVMLLSNGQRSNYGSIRVEDGHFVHYTGLGLREIWSQNGAATERSKELKMLSEQQLLETGHISLTPITEIVQILS